MSYQTPFVQEEPVGNYEITMPASVTQGSDIYVFTGWQDGNASNPRTINLQADTSVVATYTKQNLPPPTGPTPLTSSLAAGNYQVSVPLNVTVNGQQYVFQYWEDGSTNPVRNISLTKNTTILATFGLTSVTLDVVAGANGSVSPTGPQNLTVGQLYTFAATPNSGYQFDHWDLAGSNIGSTNPISITATEGINKEILTAIFTIIPPVQISMNLTVSGQGSTNPSVGSHTFNVGDSVQLTAIPVSGSTFKDWKLDGTISTQNPLTLTITQDLNGKTLTAEFTGPTPITSSAIAPVAIGILAVSAVVYYLATRKKK